MTQRCRHLALGLAVMLTGWGARGSELPVSRVVLFTSGVGFFQREGRMEGRQTVDLAFAADQVADVIKTLTLVDAGGGKLQAVTYDARDPVERTLGAFSVDLSDNPSLGALLNRIRGVPVKVEAGAQTYVGAVLGVEKRRQTGAEPRTVVDVEYVNLATGTGLRSLPLTDLQSIAVQDPAVSADIEAALDVLAGSVARDRRGVRLSFDGEGGRAVSVSYLLEAPVWKTSYRLVLDDEGGFLQGWAHVANMTEEDWIDVDLSLVSGRPISFIQNLYDPVYVERPVVEVDVAAVAPPPAYDAVMMATADSAVAVEEAPDRVARSRAMRMEAPMEGRAGAPPAVNRAALERGGVQPQTGASDTGELFRYPGGRISLRRRQSAMIPIVNASIGAAPVSVYNEHAHARHPFSGAVMTNDTGLFLMQGPVTVFAGGEYAGDARLGDTPRHEERLISFALDLESEVTVDRKSEPEEIVSIRIVRGILESSRRFIQTNKYRIRNKRDEPRAYVVQHPFRPDWTLTAPAENVERTRDEYRIRADIGPGITATLAVREERVDRQTIGLSSIHPNQVALYLRQSVISDSVRRALERLAALQREQAQARAEREQLERRVQEMDREQNRIRENMRAVTRQSESFTRWERMLVSQEDEIAQAQRDIERLRTRDREKQQEIEDFIAGLNVD